MSDEARAACRSCGSTAWHGMRIRVDGDWCTDCPDPLQVSSVPDVFFDQPGFHHGIANPDTGDPIFITSKSHKAYEMKKQGIVEVGDAVRGSRNFDPISHRHAMESLRTPRHKLPKGEQHGKHS
jgi:hypothetical protein